MLAFVVTLLVCSMMALGYFVWSLNQQVSDLQTCVRALERKRDRDATVDMINQGFGLLKAGAEAVSSGYRAASERERYSQAEAKTNSLRNSVVGY